MGIQFLNVDLEFESSEDLAPLVDDLGEDVFVLHKGPGQGEFQIVSFELKGGGVAQEPDSMISGFCDLLENLSPEVRRLWDSACRKIFDAGYSSGNSTTSFFAEIRPETVRRVSALGASIGTTIYPLGSSE